MTAAALIAAVTSPHLEPYLTERGWVIGYNHLLASATSRKSALKLVGKGWTPSQAADALREDLRAIELRLIYVLAETNTTADEFAALLALAFDVGIETLVASDLLRLHMQGERSALIPDTRAGRTSAMCAVVHDIAELPANAADQFLAFSVDGDGRWQPEKFQRRWVERSRYLIGGSSAAA